MRMLSGLIGAVAFAAALYAAALPVGTTLNDFFLPGSQPGESGNLESPNKCDNCHGGYDIAVEPAFNWRGSMMSQAARDPLFYAAMTIANQDAPESGDLCIRCHSPAGWLEGRSTPTDGSALNNNDRESVQCDFCHKLVRPTPLGVNPYPGDSAYTAGTYSADQTYLGTISEIPPTVANGMYVADENNAKRGPFTDAAATHQMYYSPFHKESAVCGTCHDVSNPAFSVDSSGKYLPNPFDSAAPNFDPYTMFPVERTYSEWLKSAFNSDTGIYAPQFGGNKDRVASCQDCHMRDVTGFGCNKSGAPERSDLPLHDMTGGNTFIPLMIDSVFPGEAYPAALDSGILRARYMLQNAATLTLGAVEQGPNYALTVTVYNETGHKLPSGYPEGRRMWLNVRAYNASAQLIYESGAYDTDSALLTADADAKIYEIKPGISNSLSAVVGLPAGPSFHFVINDTIYKDNRIPPRGFTNAAFDSIQSPPVAHTYADGQYWDETEYIIPGSTAKVLVTFYYQTVSKEYVEFLQAENVTDSWGDTLYNLWSSLGKSPPEAMNVDSLLLTPMAGNQAPILDPIGDKSVDEGQLLEFLVTATDPDGDSIVLDTSALPTGAAFVDSGNGTGLFSWMPGFDQAGNYPVTFYATDDSGAVDSEAITITVHNVNRPPVLDSIGDQSADEGQLLEFLITATDPDGDNIVLDTSALPTGAAFVDSGNGTGLFSWTPGFDQSGNYPVTFYATDDSGAVDSEAISITVFNVNRPPVLDSIGDKSINEGVLLQFLVTATDPDGDNIVLDTSALPTGAAFVDSGNGAGLFSWMPDIGQAGDYPMTFYATDDSGAVDSEAITITVLSVNQAPVLDSIGNRQIDEGQLLQFLVTATDPNGDAIVLDTSALPTGAAFVDSGNGTGLFSWMPGYDQEGDYPVTFYATDDSGAVDSEAITITVLNVNRPPVLDSIGARSVDVGSQLQFVVSASDPDGTIPQLSAPNKPGTATFTDHANGTATFDWTPAQVDTGTHSVWFIADDGDLSDSELVAITVLDTATCCNTDGITGDADSDCTFGCVTVSDLSYLVTYLFQQGPAPACEEEGNADGDCSLGCITVSDLSYLVTHLFQGGPPPAACP